MPIWFCSPNHCKINFQQQTTFCLKIEQNDFFSNYKYLIEIAIYLHYI